MAVATVVQPHVKRPIDPLKVIPPQYRPQVREPVKSPAQRAEESRFAWQLLDRVWGRKRKG